jgi:hypothetical protein
MRRVMGFLSTTSALVRRFDSLAAAEGMQTEHLVDEALLARARSHGLDDPTLRANLSAAIDQLAASTDLVVCTCSTIGGLAETLGAGRVVRVDRALAEAAVAEGHRIAVVVCVESTVGPTIDLLQAEAVRQDKQPTLELCAWTDLWPLWEAADVDGYHAAIAKRIAELPADVDTVVLGQASMEGAIPRYEGLARRLLCAPPIGVAAAAGRLRG